MLSAGRRCRLEGYGFHWDAFADEPYVPIIDDIPYVKDQWNGENVPTLLENCGLDMHQNSAVPVTAEKAATPCCAATAEVLEEAEILETERNVVVTHLVVL